MCDKTQFLTSVHSSRQNGALIFNPNVVIRSRDKWKFLLRGDECTDVKYCKII